MKIPQDLQHFPHQTLVVAADHQAAKFFLVGGDELEELDGLSEPREFKQDSEGYFASVDAARHGSPSADIDDAPRLKEFSKKVALRIADLVRHHGAAHVDLVMPAQVEHLVSEHLPNDAKAVVRRVKHLDLMKESPLEILKRSYI